LDGQLLCGALDKSQFGASEFGMVHSVYELYGATAAGRLLGILSRLFTKYLQGRAFTCRMDDLALTPEGDAKRENIVKGASSLGTAAAKENFPALESLEGEEQEEKLRSLLEEILHDNERMAALDAVVQNKLRALHKSIADAVMPGGLVRKFPDNHMQTMTLSGAKGGTVNVQQISCALGQQSLEGRRVPVMVSGKTLPSFQAYETAAIAGGFIGSRFLTGIRPQEFFFHCMAGREGLIDTAVKTSRSGYLQRCLIKHLEGLRVHYDHTFRDADGSIYQFLYGGDGLDVTRQKHLYEFDFSTRNSLSLLNRYQPRHLAGKVDDSEAIKYMKKTLKQLSKGVEPAPLPALSCYHPNRHLGSTSERFAAASEKYLKENPGDLIKSKHAPEPRIQSRNEKLSSHVYRMLMNVRYMRSLADPGEAVGLLASQG
jgi:DNA-directed RNA polymerase I subunit RPA1